MARKCKSCPVIVRTGKSRCQQCLANHAAKMRELAANRRQIGICTTCGKFPAISNRSCCQSCRDKIVKSSDLARKRRLARGCCVSCSRPSLSQRCDKCLETKAVDSKKLRQSKSIDGKCLDCSKPVMAGRYCDGCKLKRSVKASVRRHALMESGLCIMCAESPVDSGSQRCSHCTVIVNESQYQKTATLKLVAFEMYGGPICKCCGEDHLSLLTIDHIDNNGAEHRLTAPESRRIYHWLKKHDYPDGFQVLCWSCNIGKYLNGGVCPHQQ